MDPSVFEGMTEGSVQQYRRELREYYVYLRFHNCNPYYSFQFDDLLLEFKNHVSGTVPGISPPTRSKFEKLVAALEKICPHFKNDLVLARSTLLNWRVSVTVHHAVPLTPRWALVICLELAEKDGVWTSVVLFFQSIRGLRPGESMGLSTDDLVLPEENPGTSGVALLLLGVSKRTKSGRKQFVAVRDPLAIEIMRAVRRRLPRGTRICTFSSLGVYNSRLRSPLDPLNLPNTGWSGHSPRAGFATHAFLDGVPCTTISEILRHGSPKTLKIYLDAAAVTASQLARDLLPHEWRVSRAAELFPPLILHKLRHENVPRK